MSVIPPSSRREFLSRSGMGIGWLALLDLMSREALTAEVPTFVPGPHRAPRAKAVISLFMHGGPSQVDTFDPKPLLAKYSGQTLPASFGNLNLEFTKASTAKARKTRNGRTSYSDPKPQAAPLLPTCTTQSHLRRKMGERSGSPSK